MAQELDNRAQGLHIGFIMDGNGRWAKKRGLPRNAGHKKGAQVFQDITRYCNELGVASASFYAFSTENWKRPEAEIQGIMTLFQEYLLKAFDYKKENNRVCFLGDRTVLSEDLVRLMEEIEQKTKENTGMILNVAINYGGRDELIHAVRGIAQDVQNKKLLPQQVDAECISNRLYTAGQKDPDFILRPSGEMRLSNFLLWQCAYSEFIFMDVLWPDFTRHDLDVAIDEYNHRSRRFGGL